MPSSAFRDELTHARRLAQRGLLGSALELLHRRLEKYPDDGRAWELQGLILRHDAHWAAAREALEQASVLVPLTTAGQLAWVESYVATGTPERALPLLAHLLSRDDLGTCNLPQLAARFARAGSSQGAMQVCRAWVRRQSDSDVAHFALAYHMIRLNQSPRRVLPMLSKAIRLAPERWHYQLTLVQYLVGQHDRGGAYAALVALPYESFDALECDCCLQRLMDLCIEFEDYERCARLSARRRQLGPRPSSCL